MINLATDIASDALFSFQLHSGGLLLPTVVAVLAKLVSLAMVSELALELPG